MWHTLDRVLFHPEGFSERSVFLSRPQHLPFLSLNHCRTPTLLLTGSVLDFSPSPGLCFCWRTPPPPPPPPLRACMKGWTEKGGSVQQANQAFCLRLCRRGWGGGLLYLALEKQQQQLVQRKRRETKTEGGGGDREEEREVEYIEVCCVSGLSLIGFNRKCRILYQVPQQV